MLFLYYLVDHLVSLLLLGISFLFIYFMLIMCAVSVDTIIAVEMTVVIAWFVGFLIDYFRHRKYLVAMKNIARKKTDRALEEGMLIPRVHSCTGALVDKALQVILADAQERIGRVAQDEIEYRSYIEAWVHEVKTPISAIRLMLANEPTTYATRLASQLSRIDNYVEQALYFSRSQTVNKDYAIRQVQASDVVFAAVRARACDLIGCGIAVQMHGLDEPILCDAKLVNFILGQLLDNAIKYRASNDEKRTPTITFRAKRLDKGMASERVELTVSDNGWGIPSQDISRIFEKGFVGENGRNPSQTRSTGLGLWLVKRLCTKAGINIAVTSEVGVFTTFTLTFMANKMHYLYEAAKANTKAAP